MGSRDQLQAKLELLLGSRNVYFQPPPNHMIRYPCIVYELADMEIQHADNTVYELNKRYTLTVIDEDPDSPYPDLLIYQPYTAFDRKYVADNLNHFSFNVYF